VNLNFWCQIAFIISLLATGAGAQASARMTMSGSTFALGRLSQITPPADSPSWNATTAVFESVSAAEYGLAAGHWRQTIATGNARTITYFDALWRPALTRTFDAADEANTRSMVLRKFDADGRSTFVSYPARSIVAVTDTPGGLSTQYDALGRAASVQASSELGVLSTVNYFDPGFQARQINPRGHTTTTGYTAWDRPEQASISSIAAPEGVSVSISRDVFGKPLSITRAGAGASVTRSYVYDANQLLCKTIEPETGATIQVLDAANNVTWRASGQTFTSTGICNTANVSAPAKTSFSYDTRNRLLSTSFGDASPAITRTYTNDGLLASINSNAANWSYSYNKLRLLATENLSYNSVAYNTTRSYDANGSLSQLSYPPTLVCDGYAAYDTVFKLEKRVEAGCLAHARRKFDELFKDNQSPVATQAVQRIARLYAIEREARGLSVEQRLDMRQARAKPLYEDMHVWLQLERSRVPDGSAIANAIDYSLNRWTALMVNLVDGDVPIDNNHIENLMRPWAMGRKAWLFAGSELAGQRAAIVMSLVQSAKMHGHDPWAYLKDVLTRLPSHLNSRIDELLPHRWQPQV
jgi:hypothetical protein